jgi:hypothetical protein
VIPIWVLVCGTVLFLGLGSFLLNTEAFAELGPPVITIGALAAWELVWTRKRSLNELSYIGMLGNAIGAAIAAVAMFVISALVPAATNAKGLAFILSVISAGLALYTWWIWRKEGR